jgi:hypothetical protein
MRMWRAAVRPWRGCTWFLHHPRPADEVQPRKLAGEIGIAAGEERGLLAAADAAPRRLAVFCVEGVDHVHALDDAAERRETLRIQGLRVVPQVDEHLGRPPVGNGECEGHGASPIGLAGRIVRQGPPAPQPRDLGIARDAELRPLAGDHPKEARLVEVAVADKVEEAVSAQRRPVAVDLHDHQPLAGLQPDHEPLRGPPVHLRRLGVQQGRRGTAPERGDEAAGEHPGKTAHHGRSAGLGSHLQRKRALEIGL